MARQSGSSDLSEGNGHMAESSEERTRMATGILSTTTPEDRTLLWVKPQRPCLAGNNLWALNT